MSAPDADQEKKKKRKRENDTDDVDAPAPAVPKPEAKLRKRDLEARFQCTICFGFPLDPVATCSNMRTPHIACATCIAQWVPQTCPSCREENKDQKQKWKKLEPVAKILSAARVSIPCRLCKNPVLYGDYQSHQLQSCLENKVKCEHCATKVAYFLKTSHESQCPERKETCELCKKSVLYKNKETHDKWFCLKRKVKCPNKGCTYGDDLVDDLFFHMIQRCDAPASSCPTVQEMVDQGARVVLDDAYFDGDFITSFGIHNNNITCEMWNDEEGSNTTQMLPFVASVDGSVTCPASSPFLSLCSSDEKEAKSKPRRPMPPSIVETQARFQNVFPCFAKHFPDSLEDGEDGKSLCYKWVVGNNVAVLIARDRRLEDVIKKRKQQKEDDEDEENDNDDGDEYTQEPLDLYILFWEEGRFRTDTGTLWSSELLKDLHFHVVDDKFLLMKSSDHVERFELASKQRTMNYNMGIDMKFVDTGTAGLMLFAVHQYQLHLFCPSATPDTFLGPLFFHEPQISSFCISPDKKTLITSAKDNEIYALNANTGEVLFSTSLMLPGMASVANTLVLGAWLSYPKDVLFCSWTTQNFLLPVSILRSHPVVDLRRFLSCFE